MEKRFLRFKMKLHITGNNNTTGNNDFEHRDGRSADTLKRSFHSSSKGNQTTDRGRGSVRTSKNGLWPMNPAGLASDALDWLSWEEVPSCSESSLDSERQSMKHVLWLSVSFYSRNVAWQHVYSLFLTLLAENWSKAVKPSSGSLLQILYFCTILMQTFFNN